MREKRIRGEETGFSWVQRREENGGIEGGKRKEWGGKTRVRDGRVWIKERVMLGVRGEKKEWI